VRKLLDALYDGAAGLAALCMVGLLGMVLLSIVGRQLHFHLPGTDAYAGYLMAAAGFLALAHTLKKGEHIRVTLVLSALHGAPGVRWRSGRWLRPRCWQAVGLVRVPAVVAVAPVPRHLHRQRRHAAVDPAAGHGGGLGDPGRRLRRRAGAGAARPARGRQTTKRCTTSRPTWVTWASRRC
jgi:hypothetical protein